MHNPHQVNVLTSGNYGFQVFYCTSPGGYRPPHWHEEIEILFLLNGDMTLTVEGQNFTILPKQMMVIESGQFHSSYAQDRTAMYLSIRVNKKALHAVLPDVDLRHILCSPDQIKEEHITAYQAICDMLSRITTDYVSDSPFFQIEAEALILQSVALLYRHFSSYSLPHLAHDNQLVLERMREIVSFVEDNYAQPISLQEAADVIGVGREHFCRFFKKNMELSFQSYVTVIRLGHAYRDLQTTDLPVSVIMEQNGFTNQKLFNKSFKEFYGVTPRQIRSRHHNIFIR